MTPRERWLALLEGGTPDRLPTDYWATPEFHQRLLAATGCRDNESLWRRLGIDRPRYVGPRFKPDQAHPDDPEANRWGVRRASISYGTGEYLEPVYAPLAEMTEPEQVHGFRWPSPDDFDYEEVARQVREDDGFRILQGGGYEPFLLYCEMRGLQQAFEDLVADPEMVQAGMGHIFDFHYEHNRRIWEAGSGRIQLMYLAEDLGSQTGPLMSLDCYREFIRPGQLRMAELARSHGVHVMYHTDGSARCFLEDLIGIVGIELLNPIQWRCPGMERDGLARDFGARVIFHGGIDNQHTLPFGTPEEVRAEVLETAELFRGCRWICAPCHNIQAVSPVENVLALYQTAKEVKWP